MAATINETFKINSSIQNCFPFQDSIQRFNGDKIIINESVNLTLIYDLTKLYCLRSFTFTSLLPLTAPMIYDRTTDQLIAIKNKTKIDLIKNETECDNVHSIKLNKDQKIKCILTGANCASLVVFENMRLCELEKIIQNESVNFNDEEDSHQLTVPTKDSSLERLVVIEDEASINQLKFWTLFIDKKQAHHYLQFNFNFILNELVCSTKIVARKPDLYKSISFSLDGLFVITQENKFKALNRTHEEFIFDLILKDQEQLLDHGYLSLQDNVSAIALLTYNKNENTHFLIAYDLNLRMEMRRIALSIQNEFNQIKLICLNSNIFIQTDTCLIYIPVQIEQLSLADLVKTYKSNLNELELTFDGIMGYLNGNDVKPIDKEYLLVEALDQFVLVHEKELEITNMNNGLSSEIEMANLELSKLPSSLTSKLDQLFAITFNHDLMIQQLKSKQFNRDYLIKILGLLNKALNSQNCALVIDWINVLIDSYFICLNSSNNLDLIKHLNLIKIQLDHLILKSKNEKDLKCLLATLLLALNESNQVKRTRITLPDKHLGYKLEEIYL